MASSSSPRDGENTNSDVDERPTVGQPGSLPREDRILQQITHLHLRLNVIAQRQNEMMGRVGVRRGQQQG